MTQIHHSNHAGKPPKDKKSTDSKWIKLGDAGGTLTKKLLLQGYAWGALSVDLTQSLIDTLEVNDK